MTRVFEASSSRLIDLGHPINGPIATETGPQGRRNVGRLLEVVHETGTLAHQRVEFVAGRNGLVQRDPAQAYAARDALVKDPRSCPVEPVALKLFSIVSVKDFVDADDVARLVGDGPAAVGLQRRSCDSDGFFVDVHQMITEIAQLLRVEPVQ